MWLKNSFAKIKFRIIQVELQGVPENSGPENMFGILLPLLGFYGCLFFYWYFPAHFFSFFNFP